MDDDQFKMPEDPSVLRTVVLGFAFVLFSITFLAGFFALVILGPFWLWDTFSRPVPTPISTKAPAPVRHWLAPDYHVPLAEYLARLCLAVEAERTPPAGARFASDSFPLTDALYNATPQSYRAKSVSVEDGRAHIFGLTLEWNGLRDSVGNRQWDLFDESGERYVPICSIALPESRGFTAAELDDLEIAGHQRWLASKPLPAAHDYSGKHDREERYRKLMLLRLDRGEVAAARALCHAVAKDLPTSHEAAMLHALATGAEQGVEAGVEALRRWTEESPQDSDNLRTEPWMWISYFEIMGQPEALVEWLYTSPDGSRRESPGYAPYPTWVYLLEAGFSDVVQERCENQLTRMEEESYIERRRFQVLLEAAHAVEAAKTAGQPIQGVLQRFAFRPTMSDGPWGRGNHLNVLVHSLERYDYLEALLQRPVPRVNDRAPESAGKSVLIVSEQTRGKLEATL